MTSFLRRTTTDAAAIDADSDLDLVALINETRDPVEIRQLAKMARSRQRARRRADAVRRTRTSSHGHRVTIGRLLSSR